MQPYREETIAASVVPKDPVACPRCRKQNLTLKGNLTRGWEERLQEGKVVEQKFAESLERETYVIDCHDCRISWQIMTEAEAELADRNLGLETSLMMQSPHFSQHVSKLVH